MEEKFCTIHSRERLIKSCFFQAGTVISEYRQQFNESNVFLRVPGKRTTGCNCIMNGRASAWYLKIVCMFLIGRQHFLNSYTRKQSLETAFDPPPKNGYVFCFPFYILHSLYSFSLSVLKCLNRESMDPKGISGYYKKGTLRTSFLQGIRSVRGPLEYYNI